MKTIVSIMGLPFLSACSMGVYGDHFECSPDKGMGCLSVSRVNEVVSQERDKNRPASSACLISPTTTERVPSHRRIYFPSFHDQEGRWHEGRFVYFAEEIKR